MDTVGTDRGIVPIIGDDGVIRTDGSTMVNYGAWPLYYFAKDKAPGDTTGQGVQDVWYVVGVDGQPIKTPSS